jgi:hypothetical protein
LCTTLPNTKRRKGRLTVIVIPPAGAVCGIERVDDAEPDPEVRDIVKLRAWTER